MQALVAEEGADQFQVPGRVERADVAEQAPRAALARGGGLTGRLVGGREVRPALVRPALVRPVRAGEPPHRRRGARRVVAAVHGGAGTDPARVHGDQVVGGPHGLGEGPGVRPQRGDRRFAGASGVEEQ